MIIGYGMMQYFIFMREYALKCIEQFFQIQMHNDSSV